MWFCVCGRRWISVECWGKSFWRAWVWIGLGFPAAPPVFWKTQRLLGDSVRCWHMSHLQFYSVLRECSYSPPPPSVLRRPCLFCPPVASTPLDLWPSHFFIPLLLISLQRSHPCLFHFHLCLEVLHLFLWKNVPSYVMLASSTWRTSFQFPFIA